MYDCTVWLKDRDDNLSTSLIVQYRQGLKYRPVDELEHFRTQQELDVGFQHAEPYTLLFFSLGCDSQIKMSSEKFYLCSKILLCLKIQDSIYIYKEQARETIA